jgi:hypothetical protein
MNSFCPDSFKVERLSSRFTISSASKPREIIVTDLVMRTQARYSHAAAEELLTAIARALRESTECPSGRMMSLRERVASLRETK